MIFAFIILYLGYWCSILTKLDFININNKIGMIHFKLIYLFIY